MEVNEGKNWSKNKMKKGSRISLPLSLKVLGFRRAFGMLLALGLLLSLIELNVLFLLVSRMELA